MKCFVIYNDEVLYIVVRNIDRGMMRILE